MDDVTNRLLGLDGLAVTGVAIGPLGPVVDLVTADEQARRCPECGTRSRRSKGRRVTGPRDLPVGGRPTRLRWFKRRWRCDEPGCARSSFTEVVPAVPARKRLTGRLRSAAGAVVADGGRTIVQSARDHDVSWPIVSAAFTAHAAAVLADQPQPVEVLSIDEVRRGRAKWEFDEAAGTWKTVVDRWHVGLVDLSGGQGLLGQVEGRTADSDLPELERLATTVQTWWPEILAFLRTGIINAGSEATNRVTKTLARAAYGFRNPVNQRLRSRCATTRRHRGHLVPR